MCHTDTQSLLSLEQVALHQLEVACLPPHALSLQSEGLRGRTHSSPKSLLDWPPQNTWPGQLPSSSFYFPEPPPFCSARVFTSEHMGRCLLCSPAALLLDSRKPEGTQTRVSPSPLRISQVPDPCCCVSCLPIDPVWQTLLSLQGVTQVPIFS